MILGSFDVNSFMISLFLSFKAIKAKKAAHLARNAKLDRWIDIFPKMLSSYPVAVFILPKRPIWAGKSNSTILKAKTDLEDRETVKYAKKHEKELTYLLNTYILYINHFLYCLQISGLQGPFWPLELLYLTFLPKLAF